jgi:hypothetical protein
VRGAAGATQMRPARKREVGARDSRGSQARVARVGRVPCSQKRIVVWKECKLEGFFTNLHVWSGPTVDVAPVNTGQTDLGPRVKHLQKI